MNSKVRVNTVNELLKTAKLSIDESMVIPKSVWDRLSNDKTANSIRDRVNCIPVIRKKD